jgi:hypothetical protein
MMFVHLKKDLDNQPVDWIGCQDRSDPLPPTELTSYGIQKGLQRRLAAIRTDLDSFSDVEACALMTSGYLSTETVLTKPILGFEVNPSPRSGWWFLKIEPLLSQPSALSPQAYWLDRQLGVGSKLAFNVWLLMGYLQFLAGLVVAAAVVAIPLGLWQLYIYAERPFSLGFTATYGDIFWSIVSLLLTLCGLGLIAKLVNYRKTLSDWDGDPLFCAEADSAANGSYKLFA